MDDGNDGKKERSALSEHMADDNAGSTPLWPVYRPGHIRRCQVSKGVIRDVRETFGRGVWLGQETGHNVPITGESLLDSK